MADRVSDEQVAEMLAGLEGVTPGPWKDVCQPNFGNGYTYTSVQPVVPNPETMRHLAMASGEYHVCRMTHTPMESKYRKYRHDAAHIARCDPDTIRSILTELQERRASPAIEGGVKGLTVDDVEEIILKTEPPAYSDAGDKVWTRRMAVALATLVTARAESAEAALRDALEVVRPFAMEGWADENGWTDRGCPNDRVCDWFGPSDFRRARQFLEIHGGRE